MKITSKWTTNLKTKEVENAVNNASKATVKEVVVLIASDVKKGSPVLTGHNRRSIVFKVGSFGVLQTEGQVYSTSGYGGYLELYHREKAGYFRRALEAHMGKLPSGIKARLS